MQKANFFGAIKYFIFFCTFYLLFKAQVGGSSTYFALAFLLAAAWCNQKIYYLSPLLIISALLSGVPLLSIAVYGVSCLFLSLAYCIHLKLKKPLGIFSLNIYLFISLLFNFILATQNSAIMFRTGINIVLCLIFFNAAINILQPILIRKKQPKFNADELISGGFFLIMLAAGFSQIQFFEVKIGAFFIYILIFLSTFIFKNNTSIVFAAIAGLGYLIAGENLNAFAIFISLALITFSFKKAGKAYSVLAGFLIMLVLVYHFEIYEGESQLASLLIFVLSGGTFLLINNSFIKSAEEFFERKRTSASSQVSALSKKSAYQKLIKTSEVFLAIENVFKKSMKKTLAPEAAKDVLAGEVISGICKKCPKYTVCHTLTTEVKPAVGKMIQSGLTRGKITILDVPPHLTGKCANVPQLINVGNDLCRKYLKFNLMQKNSNAGIEIMTDQMASLSKSLTSLAESMRKKTVFNLTMAEKIEESLIYNNIAFEEVLCFEDDNGRIVVSIAVKKDVILNIEDIENLVAKTVKIKMEFAAKNEVGSNFIINFCESPRLDIVFGVASETKTGSEASGDCHSFIKLESGRFLLALCDGMGSGERAAKTSEEAISLIENFYKAGFENDLILNNVNRLLNLGGDEEFSALDICILDLFKNQASFFKLGAPEGYLKNSEDVKTIESGALPIGILNEMQPKVTTFTLAAQDVAILVTDGISDAFASTEALRGFIEFLDSSNPQTIANEILNRAKKLSGGTLSDDSTVIAARIFAKL